MIYSEVTKATDRLVNTVPFLSGIRTESDYEEAVALVEYLLENNANNILIDLLTSQIDKYEESAPEFADFNHRLTLSSDGVSLLRVIMDQHGLGQSDFENEIGKKSLVSRILSGERALTLEHMRALAKRFNIPVSAFVD